jgi:DUF4097 and DUF4098 domain-containing protein YvlB
MRTLLFATAAFLAVAPACQAQRDGERQKIDTTFAFTRGGVVDLGIVSGEIIVTGWSRSDVKINASIEVGYLETSLSPSRVTISAHSRNGRMRDARYELSVPVGTEVRASSVSGNIVVRGAGGPAYVHSVSGDVEVRDAADRVEIETVSGEIRASRLSGRVRANTVSGDLTLEDINGDLNGKSVSGDINARGSLSGAEFESVSGSFTFSGDLKDGGNYSVNTHSGDIRLTVPSDLGATLDLQTFSGSVESAFGMTLQPGEQPMGRRNHRMRFTVNGGGARISLETFSGDINIDKGAARARKED